MFNSPYIKYTIRCCLKRREQVAKSRCFRCFFASVNSIQIVLRHGLPYLFCIIGKARKVRTNQPKSTKNPEAMKHSICVTYALSTDKLLR